jgi:hypothetical protein
LVPIPAAESNHQRWIATENYGLYRAAFATEVTPGAAEDRLLRILADSGPVSTPEIVQLSRLSYSDVERHLDRLLNAYLALRLAGSPEGTDSRSQGLDTVLHVAASSWIPDHLLEGQMTREDARLALVRKFLRTHGPVTKYEVMERYALPGEVVEHAFEVLRQAGAVTTGEYGPTKSFPQWCYRRNLEQIHRLTLNRLRREMEPATPEEYAEFLIRWQHVHPDTQLSGVEGLREILSQLQGQENYQIVYERDVLPSRIPDYAPAMLDRLCYSGEVFWRRFDYRTLRRGYIGFCFRQDRDWMLPHPEQVEMDLARWDDDIPQACHAARGYLRRRGASFFDEIVRGTQLDWRLVLRAVWHLVWTGEVTNDSYESIRHADIASGLSACYDLGTKPGRKGVTLDFIVRHMLELRKLDPRLGRWAPTERLVPASAARVEIDRAALCWARLLLKRYGIVSREAYGRETVPVDWREVRRALVRLELLGEVRRGFFVEELSGEQYAYPHAIDSLRDTRLRFLDSNGGGSDGSGGAPRAPADEPMILLNACDPANPFGALFRARNEVGEEIKFLRIPQKLLVMQSGQPLLLYEGGVKVLVDLDRQRAERAVRALIRVVDCPAPAAAHTEIHIRDWNGHPIDVSPARHLLLVLGFRPVANRWKGAVYDGIHRPEPEMAAQAERQIPDVFKHLGKEQAPVRYDAEWIVFRSHSAIRAKVRELIAFLQRALPPECEFEYGPRQLVVRYRGFRCLTPYVQQRQVYLQITHKGWTRGIQVKPETDLDEPSFLARFQQQFDRTRKAIDDLLDARER